MNKSDSINELAAALAKAQAEIEGAAKDAENPHFRSHYATLDSIWNACRGPLTKHGLSVVQAPHSITDANGKVSLCLTTMLLHSSGQWLDECCEIPLVKPDAQGLIASLTYLRRGCLAAFAGVAPTDDDDGEKAVGRGEGKPPSAARAKMNEGSTITHVPKREPEPILEVGKEPEDVGNGKQDAVEAIKATIKALCEATGDREVGMSAAVKEWIKEEFGVTTKTQYAALSLDKVNQIQAGMWINFGPKKEPGENE